MSDESNLVAGHYIFTINSRTHSLEYWNELNQTWGEIDDATAFNNDDIPLPDGGVGTIEIGENNEVTGIYQYPLWAGEGLPIFKLEQMQDEEFEGEDQ